MPAAARQVLMAISKRARDIAGIRLSATGNDWRRFSSTTADHVDPTNDVALAKYRKARPFSSIRRMSCSLIKGPVVDEAKRKIDKDGRSVGRAALAAAIEPDSAPGRGRSVWMPATSRAERDRCPIRSNNEDDYFYLIWSVLRGRGRRRDGAPSLGGRPTSEGHGSVYYHSIYCARRRARSPHVRRVALKSGQPKRTTVLLHTVAS